MSKRASVYIIAILMGSGLLAAYHADSQNSARSSVQKIQYQDKDMAPVKDKLALIIDKHSVDETLILN